MTNHEELRIIVEKRMLEYVSDVLENPQWRFPEVKYMARYFSKRVVADLKKNNSRKSRERIKG